MNTHQIVNILMIDDDSLDVESFKQNLTKRRILNPFTHAIDGVEGLEILRGQHPTKSITRPLLILLDINMPRMNGLEFLQEIRKDSELKDLVVFIMTTSVDEHDMYEAYNLNVAGYMVKSELGQSFVKTIEMLDSYFHAIVMPTEER